MTRFQFLFPVAGALALFTAVNIQSAGAGAWHRPAKLSAHRLWVRSIQPNADSAPAYLAHVRLTNGRLRDLVFVLAGNNTADCATDSPVRHATLYAFDAASGTTIWSRSTSGASRCTTAGPVTDPVRGVVYAPGLDGKEHRYGAASGRETLGHGWPVPITLMPDVEKTSATATMGTGHLYVTTSGFIGDQGHYQGHLVTIDLGSGRSRVFNSLCSNIRSLLSGSSSQRNYCPDVQSGLFGRGQGSVDPVTHDIYVVSGNGPWNGHTNWGDSVLRLDPSGARLLDSFTPTNQQELADQDADLGSTGTALLPTVRQGNRRYRLAVQGGKGTACGTCGGTALRLLNRDDLSGKHGPGHLGGDLQDVQSPGGCPVLTAPAVWKDPGGHLWVFYADRCGLAGYMLVSPTPGRFRLRQIWSVSHGGTTPVIKGSVLYVARSGEIDAYDPSSHALLWHTGFGDLHWQYPLVTRTRLFMTNESGRLYAYALAR